MSYYKFEEDDLFINTIEAYPQYRFYVQSGSIYINNMPHVLYLCMNITSTDPLVTTFTHFFQKRVTRILSRL
jgi:hypothetical protein